MVQQYHTRLTRRHNFKSGLTLHQAIASFSFSPVMFNTGHKIINRSFWPGWVRLPFALAPVLLLGAGMARGSDGPGAKPAVKAAASTTADASQQNEAFEKQIKPMMQQFCVACHGKTNPAGGVSLVAENAAVIQKDQANWRKVVTRIRERSMPPQTAPQPTQMQRDAMTLWLTQTLDSTGEHLLPKSPGRVLIHRLNRVEYNNTMRDLLGVNTKPADSFPADGGGGGGFDNNADTLFIPPILMERYLGAASDALAVASPSRLFVVRPGKGIAKREAARQSLARLASRAFRRPAQPDEIARLLRLYDRAAGRGESWEAATKFALKAVLVSPAFLFRVEQSRPGTAPYPLDDYELASRLSYFLWASMPDDVLLRLAAQGKLHTPSVLANQAKRMLADAKANAFADSFAGQWLHVRDLYTSAKPDPNRFPKFTPALRDAMYQEPIALFSDVMRNNASLLTLLDADYTYVNEELAKCYGIPGIIGAGMRRVSLASGKTRTRGGILTMGSVLTLTSYPLRTSPVLRGKWVMENVLGATVPPPPPVVATLSQDDHPDKTGLTFRQRLEQHRKKPECAGCHSRMDPIGFGLENFDATGTWRDEIGGKPVDASGVLTSGDTFTGPAALKARLMAQKAEFVRNLTEKMLAYALGRGLEPYDLPAVRKITEAVTQDNYRSGTLVREIVQSFPFRYRQNEPDDSHLAAK